MRRYFPKQLFKIYYKPAVILMVGLFFISIFVFGAKVGAAESSGEKDVVLFEPVRERPDTFYRAKVLSVLETGKQETEEGLQEYQKLELEILNGGEKGKHIIIDHGKNFVIGKFQKMKKGEVVVVAKPADSPGAQTDFYYITDYYRGNRLLFIAAIFFILAAYFGRRHGIMSILGLILSIAVIFYGVIPQIVKGADPFGTCVAAAAAIALISLYLSHGFRSRTTVAVVSTFLALGLAVGVDLLFVYIAKLSGSGTEEAIYLQFENLKINLRGLFLGGIIIGIMGVLDDVTTAQTATVEEIHLANGSLEFKELYRRGLSVGREHIASLVNTLVFAYAGVSLPLLILYTAQGLLPLWVRLNGNFIAEEIVRTIIGSTVLVLTVPLTTFLAAWFYGRNSTKRMKKF